MSVTEQQLVDAFVANEEVIDAARKVLNVATRKGQLFVTDPVSGSDKLVGFFVPADELLALGRAIVAALEVAR